MQSFTMAEAKKESFEARKERAAEILRRLKRAYPKAKIALKYGNNIQLLVAVILSAQCTDKKVNEVTEKLFRKYRTVDDFANANLKTFEQEIKSTGFYRAKAKSIITSAKILKNDFGSKIPKTMQEILKLRGVARKTANIVLGNAYGVVIKELVLLARSIFVIDPSDTIRYIQIVPEVTSEPDYAAVMGAVKLLL